MSSSKAQYCKEKKRNQIGESHLVVYKAVNAAFPLVFNMHDACVVIRGLHHDYGITRRVNNCIPTEALFSSQSIWMVGKNG